MKRQGLYTIPSGTGFLKYLARGLLEMSSGDQSALTQMRVLLPTRRAGRELRDAFLELSKGKPLLLPRLQPIGDVDAEEIELYLSGFGISGHDIPPAISNLERQFLLSDLVQRKDSSLGLDAALSLANDLARLIDTVHTENLDFSGLKNIVPSDLSDHWAQTLLFLEIVTAQWPKILEERGQIDPADRRNRLLKSLANLWRDHPPQTPIIAAGSTGSIPSAGELLKVVANLPQGCVVLPGLDLGLDVESWDSITDNHPQATMRNLLNRMNKTRDDVKCWPESEGTQSKRINLLRAMMRPIETFGVANDVVTDSALDKLKIIEAPSPREEAAAIALVLREVLEIPNKTACFVTPDRTLARRVMTALHRWNIEVDDSAGGALATTQGAIFFLAILGAFCGDFSPLAVLDVLKHDYQRQIPLSDVNEFERRVLRGPRPAAGFDGLLRRVEIKKAQFSNLDKTLLMMQDIFAPFLSLGEGPHKVDVLCQAMIEVAEGFADKDFLWGRAESDALSRFIANVMGYANLVPALSFDMFASVFRELLTSEKYRADNEPHRRILILGQLESRLIHRDVMILGGLNEESWPRDAGHDPWMSRPMRRNFGLPSVERGVGLAAHDFAEHMSAAEVFITRSIKDEGTATVPARWLQKFRTLLKAAGKEEMWMGGSHYLSWVKSMDYPDHQSKPLTASIPAPCPPQSARPVILSATWIEKWMKNPYRVYAEKILKLKMLDPIDADKTHADRGSFVHDVLLDFVRAYPHAMPPHAKEMIIDIARQKLNELEDVSLQWHYWWPRFERLVDWFVNEEANWRKDALPWIQEETGQLEIYRHEKSGRHFTVTAKADRIDRLKTGGCAVLDYKTGTPPEAYRIRNGTAPQLPIEALILSKGGYKSQPEPTHVMAYWKLSGSYSGAGKVQPIKSEMEDVIAATELGLSNLVEKFEDPQTPYIARPSMGRLYDDERAYAHLARTSEWSSGESEGDDDGMEGQDG